MTIFINFVYYYYQMTIHRNSVVIYVLIGYFMLGAFTFNLARFQFVLLHLQNNS